MTESTGRFLRRVRSVQDQQERFRRDKLLHLRSSLDTGEVVEVSVARAVNNVFEEQEGRGGSNEDAQASMAMMTARLVSELRISGRLSEMAVLTSSTKAWVARAKFEIVPGGP